MRRPPPLTAERELTVFLFAGQSNMAGADAVINEPPGFRQTEADRSALFTITPIPPKYGTEQAPDYLPWGDIRGHRGKGGKLVHGPEVGFARTLYRNGWHNLAIVKFSGQFSPDADRWPWGPDGDLYDRWTTFVDARLNELTAQGYGYCIRGFVWHQGIDDAIHGELAVTHQQNLTRLIDTLRDRYGNETTRFVLARSVNSAIAREATGTGEQDPMAVVRRAQVAVGNSVPHAGWIDVDDLPNTNRHHFTAAAQLAIGVRFADRFASLVGNSERQVHATGISGSSGL